MMKSAKEWANEVVDGPEEGHAATSRTRRDVILRDDDDYVMVYSASPVGQRGQHCEGCVAEEELRGIIERTVERVQRNALDAFAAYFREQERGLYDGERLDFDYYMERFREENGIDKPSEPEQ